jgi:hypothetical protein
MFVITQKQSFYHPESDTKSLVRAFNESVLVFSNKDTAKAWIQEADDRAHYLSNNESARPEYKVRSIESLGKSHRFEIEAYGTEQAS